MFTCLVENRWLSNGKCGPKNKLPNGKPSECDPKASGVNKGPCCSNWGICGNETWHCKCRRCVDYSKRKLLYSHCLEGLLQPLLRFSVSVFRIRQMFSFFKRNEASDNEYDLISLALISFISHVLK